MTATPLSVERAYVGTSGWSYPSWKPGFYPAELKPTEFLGHYARALPTVELNTTGYRLPAEGQFERWAEQTPEGFRFAPKLVAYRTSQVATFEERVTRLGDRLGPIRVLVGAKRDEGFLTLLLGSLDPSLRLAFDFRHESWEDVELPPNAVRVDDLRRPPGSATSASVTRPTRRPSSATPPSASRRCSLRESRCSRISGTRTSRRRPRTRSA